MPAVTHAWKGRHNVILLIHWARDEETEIKQGKTLGRKREERGTEKIVAKPYNLKVSFQMGLRQHFMVLVFCLLSLRGSGISLSFT